MIDVSDLDNICVDEISFEDENYFFLDNGSEERKICGLLQIWNPVESRRAGYFHLSAEDNSKLKGIPELEKSNRGMWFDEFNVSNLAFLFTPDDLKSGRIPALNGMQNLYYGQYRESHGQYGELDDIKSFSSTHGYAFCIFSCLVHIRSEVDKMMYRTGLSQGDLAYIKTFVLADCWHYIRYFFSPVVIV